MVIEIVDENNRAVSPGQPGAKVLLTNLINYAQPLIRYELTDSVVESPPQSRGSALAMPALGGWAHRGHPLSPRPGWRDGRGPSLCTRVGCRAHCRGWRVLLCVRRAGPARSDRAGPEAAADVPERLRQALIAAVTSTGAVAPAVDVQPVPALQREPGGKLRVVRSA